MKPILSICIPTFNRADLVYKLVSDILREPGLFEICVHVDGSTDNTIELLKSISEKRLKISTSNNRGRGPALVSAVERAEGLFTMLFDDDDYLTPIGLQTILRDCDLSITKNIVGYIYHLEDKAGKIVGERYPVSESNFLALRADFSVQGDKKEVVLTELLLREMETITTHYRRIPTSLYWSKLALTGNVICRNVCVGYKQYLSGGMSDTVSKLKRDNPYPMLILNKYRLVGFFRKRYKSSFYAIKATVGLVYYSIILIKSKFL